jgi:hypothetical protein
MTGDSPASTASRVRAVWPGIAAVLFTSAITIGLTWPQARHLQTHVAAHVDPYFSMWRLAWVAHALGDPANLFNANIFHPELRTLAFSDAMLLQGVLAAPLFWAGFSPVSIYNLMLLAGIAGSGLGMFVLAYHLTKSPAAALVACAVFALAPYRVEHFMHLELQWTMWMPLAFWAVHRAFDERSRKWGVIAGLFVWLQIVSSVYYGVFLAIALVVFGAVMTVARPGAMRRALPGFVAGGALAVVLAIPYGYQYLRVAEAVEARPLVAIREYSATVASYFASPAQSLIWGWTADRWGGPELRLFPGTVALLLAIIGLVAGPRGAGIAYAAVAAATVELSFGLNGRVYPWLMEVVPALQGLRAPSRFAVLAIAAIAVLSAFGVQAVQRMLGAGERSFARRRQAAAAIAVVLLLTEYQTTGMPLMLAPRHPAEMHNVYRIAQSLGPGVVLELPLPRLDQLPGREPFYAFWSIGTWHRLVNGYSGYYPPSYLQTVATLERFPDASSIERLRSLSVRYVIVHKTGVESDRYAWLLLQLTTRREFRPYGVFKDPEGDAALFILE